MDKMIAIGYYKQAVEKENDEAYVNLGTAYLMGIDKVLDKDPKLAYDNFEEAMKLGNSDAYVHLSQMYEKGIYVKKDEKLAKELLVMAAMKKNQTALYILQERVTFFIQFRDNRLTMKSGTPLNTSCLSSQKQLIWPTSFHTLET